MEFATRRSMIYNAPIIDRTLELHVTQSLACAPAGSADVATDPLSWSRASRPLSDANQANELHGYFSMEPQEVASADHSNQQYSITAVTTSAGAIAERYAYSAYGEPTILAGSGSTLSNSSILNRYSYTGREWDATVGLYHFRARWMSPKTGRFLGRDPIGFSSGEDEFYCFANGQPTTHADPYGLTKIQLQGPSRNYTDPPSSGWGRNSCSIAVRCFPVVGSLTLGAGYHCGLILSDGGGTQVTIDGTGGYENNFDWKDPYHYPSNSWIDGTWVQYPASTCECLIAKARQWNTVTIPRDSFGCNSNTSLRCLNTKCRVSFKPSGNFDPKGYYGCKEYNCVKFGWHEMFGCGGKHCVEYEDFCDFFFRAAEKGIATPEAPVQLR